MRTLTGASFWPGRRLALGFVLRGVGSWLFVRALVGVMPGLLLPTLLVLGTSAGLAAVDAHRRRLPLFLSNLGVAPSAVLLYWLAPVLLLELPLLGPNVPEVPGLLARLAGA
jgi:hypothetical protein